MADMTGNTTTAGHRGAAIAGRGKPAARDLWILERQILPNQYGLKYAALSRVLDALKGESMANASAAAAAKALLELISSVTGAGHSEAHQEQAEEVIDLIGNAEKETPHARAVAKARSKR
jgi:hypothetical protein